MKKIILILFLLSSCSQPKENVTPNNNDKGAHVEVETVEYDFLLEPGFYLTFVDFPSAKYSVEYVSGEGSITGSDGGDLDEIKSNDVQLDLERKLKTEIIVTGNLVVKILTSSKLWEPIKEFNGGSEVVLNSIGRSTSFKTSLDIEFGKYNIEWINGEGEIRYFSRSYGRVDFILNQDSKIVRNVPLDEDICGEFTCSLFVDNLEIKLIPTN